MEQRFIADNDMRDVIVKTRFFNDAIDFFTVFIFGVFAIEKGCCNDFDAIALGNSGNLLNAICRVVKTNGFRFRR